MKQIFSIFACIFLATSVYAQSMIVNGELIAYYTFPVQNIEVISKELNSVVKSDSLGQFSILCYPYDIIKIKSKGFRPVTRKVQPDSDSLIINLIFINNKRNRETVIANGNISEDDLLYAVGHLEQPDQDIDFCQHSDIFELLKNHYPTKLDVHGDRVYRKSNDLSVTQQGAIPEVRFMVDATVTQNIYFIKPCNIKSISLSYDGGWPHTEQYSGTILITTKKPD